MTGDSKGDKPTTQPSDFEEWRQQHSPFRSSEPPTFSAGLGTGSRTNQSSQMWKQKAMEQENESEYYRKKFNETKSDLVTLQHEAATSEIDHAREIAETQLSYEKNLNALRKENVEGLERLHEQRRSDLEESLDLRDEITRLENEIQIQQQQQQIDPTMSGQHVTETTESQTNQRPVIFDSELRHLLTTCDMIHNSIQQQQQQMSESVNQRSKDQTEEELKRLRDKVQSLEENLNSRTQRDEHNEHSSNTAATTAAAAAIYQSQLQFSTLLEKTIADLSQKTHLGDKMTQMERYAQQMRQEEVSVLQGKLREEKEERENTREQVNRLTRCMNSKMHSEKLKEQYQEFRWKESELRNEINKLENKLKSKQTQVESVQNELNSEKLKSLKKLQIAEKQKMVLEQQLLKIDLDTNKMIKLEQELKKRDSDIDDLKEKLTSAEERERQLKRSEEQVYIEREQLRSQLNSKSGHHGHHNIDFSTLSKRELEDKLLTSEERIAKLQTSLRKAAEIHRRKKCQLQDEIHDLKYKHKLKNSLGLEIPSTKRTQYETKVPRSYLETHQSKPNSKSVFSVSSFERMPIRSPSFTKADNIDSRLSKSSSQEKSWFQKGVDFPKEDFTSQQLDEVVKRFKDDDFDLQEIFASAEQRARRSGTISSSYYPPLDFSRPGDYPTFHTPHNIGRNKPIYQRNASEPYLFPCEIVHAKTRTKANAILEKIANYENSGF